VHVVSVRELPLIYVVLFEIAADAAAVVTIYCAAHAGAGESVVFLLRLLL
jgi:hypothetical protein